MNLSTVLLLILTTTRIVVPGIASKEIGADGKEYLTPLPYSHNLSVTLANASNAKGRADLYLPEGMSNGKVIRLLPENAAPKPDIVAADTPKVVIKNYWGSGIEIPEGQPLLKETKGIDLQMQDLPEGTSAYWPELSKKNPPEPKTAVGIYTLSTDYCGSAMFTIPETQDFLAPIEMEDIPANTDTSKPINLTWKTVPGAVAYFILAQGGNMDEVINWSSSAASDYPDGLDIHAITDKEIEEMLKKGILMPADRTSCIIPPGVFKGADTFVVTMLAIGKDRVENVSGISVQVLQRSLLSIPFSTARSWK